MSVQFGRWTFGSRDEQPLALSELRSQLAPYARDAESHFRDEGIDILFCRFDETEKLGDVDQPFRVNANQFLVWDGRLDNREDLVRELAGAVRISDSDVAIVAAAYTHWGHACFARLVGDWALSIWDRNKREVVLAKDFLGARPLFYSVEKKGVQWCSILDPLVLLAGRRFSLNREYLAGWFGLFPAAHLTPYVGIHSVPPASYVVVRKESVETREFWRFKERDIIRYASDAEYEVHFRHLFLQAVRRRLRSAFPVLAELSGGMDSSSIVCVADRILAESASNTPRVDTVTYYSSIEPNWDELPYVERVEALRGRIGHRIEVRSDSFFHFNGDTSYFMPTPGCLRSRSVSAQELSRAFAESGNRVLLSGIGGDEVLGGVPSPLPELADLLKQGRLRTLSKQLISWALTLRRPLFSLLAETLALFWSQANPAHAVSPPSWLSARFLREYSCAVRGYPSRTRLFGPRPSFQESILTLEALRRQLTSLPLSSEPAYSKSYPYLDRDLLEFLFALPPSQLLRPGQRRSLMRRALAGIVPQEVLHRRRKAFVLRGPLTAIATENRSIGEITRETVCASLGILDPVALDATLREVHSGGAVSVPSLLRMFAIERWLRNVTHHKVFSDLEIDGPNSKSVAKMAARRIRSRIQDLS